MFSLSSSFRSLTRSARAPSLPSLRTLSANLSTNEKPQPLIGSSRTMRRNTELERDEDQDFDANDVEKDTTQLLFSAGDTTATASSTFRVDVTKHENQAIRRLSSGRLPAVCLLPALPFQSADFPLPTLQFIRPTDFVEPDTERRVRRKRPLLGPGAAESREMDPFYQLGIDPLYEATNANLLAFFVTEMGKVRSRAETKLTWRSQRRLTKAIRRAKMMGVIPILSRSIRSI
ncbi:hypothetical protein EW146_g5085 [Bondarzewia mesenterica]|uniref:Small ribosomal subunit protein bS18m n=1 Tax=Bondarzewia mesenterica TaxID=1095465 RepID=A0A4S4LUC7_9AGAM|nr:hypothetical protein EW146_g5085 [Bondarzewia mesenterica]